MISAEFHLLKLLSRFLVSENIILFHIKSKQKNNGSEIQQEITFCLY